MERKLKELFEYQRFENNPHLARLISETEAFSVELSDDDLAFVNAAGDTLAQTDEKKLR